MISTAVISRCGQYRYLLGRIWNEPAICGIPRIALWVMLNPSTANAMRDDATIRRCIGFSKDWGYDGMEVANLFGFRARHPSAMASVADPVGPDNDAHIFGAAARAHLIIAAWGSHHAADAPRSVEVLAMLRKHRDVLCLGRTSNGAPRHPLYVRKSMVRELLVGAQREKVVQIIEEKGDGG
jgi:hypothetical protein